MSSCCGCGAALAARPNVNGLAVADYLVTQSSVTMPARVKH